MKKPLLFLLLTFFTTAFSQIRFEKGYLINNQNEKSEVLIKNEDWLNNPTQFTYKISEDAAPKTAFMSEVKEFGVNNFSRYIRYKGLIDQSTDNLQILSLKKEPEWEEKTVFLKELATGKRNLYVYNDRLVRRFFFSDEDTEITQLIYKRYFVDEFRIGYLSNNEYQSQLAKSFAGENLDKKINSLPYKADSLTKFFKKSNAADSSSTLYDDPNSSVNLYVKPGISFSTANLKIEDGSPLNVDFGSKVSPRFGVELEYVFPFNKNKWSIFIEPNYQSYKQTALSATNNPAEIEYNSVQLPIGIKHYLFLTKDSKLFLEIFGTIADAKIGNNYIKYGIPGTTAEKEFELKADLSFGGGIGYSYKNKYLLSMKYSSKDLSKGYNFFNVPLNTFSLSAGYNIF